MKYQISITGYIGSWTKLMVRDILKANKDKHVDVAIDSLGGEVSAGLAICQMFKSHGDVTVDFQAGFSASAATICAMGASKIRMSKYSLLLVHKCSTEQFVWSALNEEQIARSSSNFKNSKRTSRKSTTSSPTFTAIVGQEARGHRQGDVRGKVAHRR